MSLRMAMPPLVGPFRKTITRLGTGGRPSHGAASTLTTRPTSARQGSAFTAVRHLRLRRSEWSCRSATRDTLNHRCVAPGCPALATLRPAALAIEHRDGLLVESACPLGGAAD